MCRGRDDVGGPKRCSGDTRAIFERSTAYLAELEDTEEVLKSALRDLDENGPARPALTDEALIARGAKVGFTDKTTRTEDIRRELDAAMDNLNTGEAWQEWLEFTSRFPSRSLANQILIQIQHPGATYVAGAKQWQAQGRNLAAGCKAIWIRAPRFQAKGRRKGKSESADGVNAPGQPVEQPGSDDQDKGQGAPVGYINVPVYDISDTAGPPLPQRPDVTYTHTTGVAPPEMHQELEKQITAHGYAVERRELAQDGPEGFTAKDPNRVVVSTRYSDAHQAMVLAHELAHIELGHMERDHDYHSRPGGQRPTMEIEAESVAYVIGRRYGLKPGDGSFAYVNGWAQGDPKKVRETASRVTKAADAILGRIPAMTPPES
ncbi:ImmA/IrrE family metallo-endopeptidase [Mycobacterium sp. 134]|uniref:ImmA/IrrE family metallo-endopeptidase n=1 Tax=Mycobacterium sp. 134 TaxID=3400425 RepID=UPI003AADC399